MCQNAIFPCLQGIIMCRSKREEQKTDVWPDKKKDLIQSSEKFQMQDYIEFRKNKARYSAIPIKYRAKKSKLF